MNFQKDSIPALILGTATLARLHNRKEIEKLLKIALDIGIHSIDTAPLYGAGAMEGLIGETIKRASPNSVTVNTKFGLGPPFLFPGASRHYFVAKSVNSLLSKMGFSTRKIADAKKVTESARKSLEASLRKIGSDKIDVFFAHEVPIDFLRTDEFVSFLQEAKTAGLYRRFGLGGFRRQYEASDYGILTNEIDVVQVESRSGISPNLPGAWKGQCFLHGILSGLGSNLVGREGSIKNRFQDALEFQNAQGVVVGFSRIESLKETIKIFNSLGK